MSEKRSTTSIMLVVLSLVTVACGGPGATPSRDSAASEVPMPSSVQSPSAATVPPAEPAPTRSGRLTCEDGHPILATVITVAPHGRAECFRDVELVLRGWVWDDQGTYDCHAGSGPPSWLSCTAEHARLMTAAYPPGDPAVLPMDPADGPLRVAFDPSGPAAAALLPSRWVEVRGRYGQPVTDSCALLADSLWEAECRGAFVVSEARIIEFPEVIAPERWARVAVDDLRLRTEPRLSSAPVGALVSDDVVLVLAGPYVFDGHWWYQVGSGASLEVARRDGWPVQGFVAAGEAESGYLEPLVVDCAGIGSGLAEIIVATAYERVECLGGQDMVLDGYLPLGEFGPDGGCYSLGEVPAFEPRWLFLACAALQPAEHALPWESLALHVVGDLASDLASLVSRGVRITGHFDDPLAASCGDRSTPPVAWGLFYPPVERAGVVLRCRSAFVLTSILALEE